MDFHYLVTGNGVYISTSSSMYSLYILISLFWLVYLKWCDSLWMGVDIGFVIKKAVIDNDDYSCL